MSTTFGILLPYNEDLEFNDDNEIEIAFRSSGVITWLNPLACLIPDDLLVEPLDNSAQGIFTIGDIKKAIKKLKDEANITTYTKQ